MISTNIFLYRSSIAVLSAHEVACDEVSVSSVSRNWSHLVLLLNFNLASLGLLMNDGYDKPSKYSRSLYVVGKTWWYFEFCKV